MKSLRLLAFAVLGAVAIAACDEGDSTGTAVEGTVRGTVTIEGSGASGITVSLSSGASMTTDGSGSYSFPNVPAGTYVVELTGTPSDAIFTTTTKTAVIATAGEVETVDFSGSFVRASAIVGNVSVAGVGPLAGVAVTLSGDGSASTTTDAAGQYAFTGLRAGSYTVTISGFDAVQYEFPSTSQTASVGTGATEIVSFTGSQVATAAIHGWMFLDENDKNDIFDGAALEAFLEAANVAITLKGPDVGNVQNTQTDSTGAFWFTDLVAGTYSVGISAADPDIPSYVAFGGDTTDVVVTLTPGQMVDVYFPFDIITQMISVCVFTGIDEVDPGHRPVPGGEISLYPLESDVPNPVTTTPGPNAFATQTTDATGCTEFSFDRVDDTSPQPGFTDHIVFAAISGPPPGGSYFGNGEDHIEIGYDPRFASSLAPDTFDVLNSTVLLARDGTTIMDVDTLAGWDWATWTDSAQTATAISNGQADVDGVRYSSHDNIGVAGLPRTLWTRLAHGQVLANGHVFEQTPDPDAPFGASGGELLRYEQDGYNLVSDTVWLGTEVIRYLDADINIVVFHEADDSLGTPMFTGGDGDFLNADEIEVSLWRLPTGGGSPVLTSSASAGSGTGAVTFNNIATDSMWAISAHPDPLLPVNKKVLMDTIYTTIEDWGGVTQNADQCQQAGSAGCGTFSYKYMNGLVNGTVRAADGTDADGVRVVISPDPMNIEPGIADSTAATWHSIVDTTLFVSGGSYFLGPSLSPTPNFTGSHGVVEGPWNVTVIDSIGVWEYFGTTNPCAGDLSGNADDIICNFTMTRMDTKILGVVVNDRDFDGTTIDPNEALGGVALDLYTTKVDPDSLIASTTSSGNGNYFFENLREGSYVVQAAAGVNTAAVVTQGMQANGSPHDTQFVTTAATIVGLGGQNTRQVGDTVVGTVGMPVLPAWNYSTSNVGGDDPSHFSFLFSNTTARGFIEDTGGNPVGGITATLQRCVQSTGFTSPPTGPLTCTSYTTEPTVNTTSDASGMFDFTGLQEGVYQITINPATGGYASATPATMLYQLRDAGDVEVPAAPFVVSNAPPPPPGPAIGLSPTSLSFTSTQGVNPSPNTQTFTVTNVGGGTLNWTATETGSWLSVSPTSGSLGAGLSATLTVTVTSTALLAGNYSEPITVTDPGAVNSPQTETVNLTVNAPTAQFAYVANFSTNNVSVIDVATNLVTATVPVGTSPFDVQITPSGSTAYVSNQNGNNVSVVDVATNTVTTTVAVGGSPRGIAITPNGASAYVANAGANSVSVIDVATNTVSTTVGVGVSPRDVAITPSGATAYVANASSNTVSVIDVATNTVTTTVAVGILPVGVAITPSGASAYVTNLGSNTVSVIDVATNTVTATVAVGSLPTGIAITPNSATVYVTNQGSSSVSVIDVATNTLVTTIVVGASPRGAAVRSDGTRAYVTNAASSTVSVIDVATNTVTATVTVGATPLGVGITP